ncbi:MAG: cob(I)yrinic acid a,c-diamide adenosyltransferase [Firmicutes bacterium]|nr:cob(I)yrinic acid a,c-diamide adenosyltransferase [Bacillota bacterium]
MTKGYVQIYTGGGKGKTTAALGLAMRAAGAGLRVFIGEFIKEMEYGEIDIIRERFPEIDAELFGIEAGCIIDREVSAEDIEAAKAGLARAKEILMSGTYDVVILDELTIPISMGLLEEEDVIALMDGKPEGTELVITGRGATEKMVGHADLVTEMKEIKHYYRQGVLSRKGIEC